MCGVGCLGFLYTFSFFLVINQNGLVCKAWADRVGVGTGNCCPSGIMILSLIYWESGCNSHRADSCQQPTGSRNKAQCWDHRTPSRCLVVVWHREGDKTSWCALQPCKMEQGTPGVPLAIGMEEGTLWEKVCPWSLGVDSTSSTDVRSRIWILATSKKKKKTKTIMLSLSCLLCTCPSYNKHTLNEDCAGSVFSSVSCRISRVLKAKFKQ